MFCFVFYQEFSAKWLYLKGTTLCTKMRKIHTDSAKEFYLRMINYNCKSTFWKKMSYTLNSVNTFSIFSFSKYCVMSKWFVLNIWFSSSLYQKTDVVSQKLFPQFREKIFWWFPQTAKRDRVWQKRGRWDKNGQLMRELDTTERQKIVIYYRPFK